MKRVYLYFSVLFFSCRSTYFESSSDFQNFLQQGSIDQAHSSLEKNRFLLKERNSLLYFLEKGKVCYLKDDYNLSNYYFNLADNFIQEDRKDFLKKAYSLITNSGNSLYRGEDFEKVAIHYYKALNYVFLKKFDDALVETKRINLQLHKIGEKYTDNKKNRYEIDAFSLNLQGMIYELSGKINDAFISYRNAVDVYLNNGGFFLGVVIPNQLKKDLFKTANILGFEDEMDYYEKKLGFTYDRLSDKSYSSEGGEAIVFWENGMVPYKEERSYIFSILPMDGASIFGLYSKDLNMIVPIPLQINIDKNQFFSQVNFIKLAFPKFISRLPKYSKGFLKDAFGFRHKFELGQNYETIAFQCLKDRASRDLIEIALRAGLKKVSEFFLVKKNFYLGSMLRIVNTLTEAADTRNWQTLPQTINYVKIPLKYGENLIQIVLETPNGTTSEKQIRIFGKGNLVFEKLITLDLQSIVRR